MIGIAAKFYGYPYFTILCAHLCHNYNHNKPVCFDGIVPNFYHVLCYYDWTISTTILSPKAIRKLIDFCLGVLCSLMLYSVS